MKKAERKYFPSYTAAISYRKVDKYAEQWKEHRPFFDTWKEAHDYMVEKAMKTIEKLSRQLASEVRHLAKVQKMVNPDTIREADVVDDTPRTEPTIYGIHFPPKEH